MQEVDVFPPISFNFILLLQMLPLCSRALTWAVFLARCLACWLSFLRGGEAETQKIFNYVEFFVFKERFT